MKDYEKAIECYDEVLKVNSEDVFPCARKVLFWKTLGGTEKP